MKFKFILASLAVLAMAAIQFAANGLFAGFAFLTVGNLAIGAIAHQVFRASGVMCTPTLITPMLVQYIAPAIRTKVPELAFFSVDTGMKAGSLPTPVKWNQEVISQIATTPTASDFTPGDSLITGAVDVTTLLTDVKVIINQAKIVRIKLTSANAAALIADNAFTTLLGESGISLGRAVISEAIATATQGNFSRELVTTLANTDFDVLGDATTSLNGVGAHTPRFCLGGSTFMQNLGGDARVASGDYRAKMVGEDPYRQYDNIEGFRSVREFPNMPSGTTTLGTFTAVAATNVITVSAAHGLAVGDRVRVSSATTLPAGLSATTDYYVLTVPSTTTLTVAASPGGTVIDITDTGTGTHTMQEFNALNAFAFAKGAIHIAIRPLLSNIELARELGIPQTIKEEQVIDPESGLSFTVYYYMDPTTTDLYAAVVVFFGVRAGRGLTGATTPALEAAGSAYDYDGLRIVQTATTLA